MVAGAAMRILVFPALLLRCRFLRKEGQLAYRRRRSDQISGGYSTDHLLVGDGFHNNPFLGLVRLGEDTTLSRHLAILLFPHLLDCLRCCTRPLLSAERFPQPFLLKQLSWLDLLVLS